MQDKIIDNLYKANIKLVDNNTFLKEQNTILKNKINKIKEITEKAKIKVNEDLIDDIIDIIEENY